MDTLLDNKQTDTMNKNNAVEDTKQHISINDVHVQKVLSQLILLGLVKENDRICTQQPNSLNIQRKDDNFIITWLKRTYYKENRKDNVQYIDQLFNESFNLLNIALANQQYYQNHDKDIELKKKLENQQVIQSLVNQIIATHKTLFVNLGVTYLTDVCVLSSLKTLQMKISNNILNIQAQLKQTLLPVPVPEPEQERSISNNHLKNDASCSPETNTGSLSSDEAMSPLSLSPTSPLLNHEKKNKTNNDKTKKKIV